MLQSWGYYPPHVSGMPDISGEFPSVPRPDGSDQMNASATVRVPRLTVPAEQGQASEPASLQVDNPPELSDELLLGQLCGGRGEALSVLFERYACIVRGVAYRILRDSSEADDLLQDLFVSIQRKCRMFDPSRGPARHWILQMAYHSALARLRYLKSRHFYTRVDLEDIENQLSNSGIDNGSREFAVDGLLGSSGMNKILDALTEDQRETLRLFFVEGYTLPEIAVKLNQTHGNVKHHYFRGLEKLRKHVFNRKLRGNSAV